LTQAAADHLRAALEQMDLLLETRQIDAGVCHLVGLVGHLRDMRRRLA